MDNKGLLGISFEFSFFAPHSCHFAERRIDSSWTIFWKTNHHYRLIANVIFEQPQSNGTHFEPVLADVMFSIKRIRESPLLFAGMKHVSLIICKFEKDIVYCSECISWYPFYNWKKVYHLQLTGMLEHPVTTFCAAQPNNPPYPGPHIDQYLTLRALPKFVSLNNIINFFLGWSFTLITKSYFADLSSSSLLKLVLPKIFHCCNYDLQNQR